MEHHANVALQGCGYSARSTSDVDSLVPIGPTRVHANTHSARIYTMQTCIIIIIIGDWMSSFLTAHQHIRLLSALKLEVVRES